MNININHFNVNFKRYCWILRLNWFHMLKLFITYFVSICYQCTFFTAFVSCSKWSTTKLLNSVIQDLLWFTGSSLYPTLESTALGDFFINTYIFNVVLCHWSSLPILNVSKGTVRISIKLSHFRFHLPILFHSYIYIIIN